MPREVIPRVTHPGLARRLLSIGVCSVVLYGVLGRVRAGSSFNDVAWFLTLFAALFLLYSGAIRLIWGAKSGKTPPQCLRWVWLFALLFRLALVPAGLPQEGALDALSRDLSGPEPGYRTFLLYDNDVGRYLWDGHVAASGLSPYSQTPADILVAEEGGEPWAEELIREERWTDVLEDLSYQDFGTVYPPLAQSLFRLSHALAPGSVAVWKLLLISLDLVVCWLFALLLRRRSRDPLEVLLYAWNPLVIKEIAGSGHLDVLVVLGLVAAVLALDAGRPRWASGALGLAILAKLTPLLVVPLFLRRLHPTHWWPLPAVLAAGYLPHWQTLEQQIGYLGEFARQWVFNPGLWGLARWLTAPWAGADSRTLANSAALIGTLALVTFWTWKRETPIEHGLLWVLGGYLVLGSTVMPWYLIWSLPFAILVRCRSYLALTALSMLSYWIYVDGVEHPAWLVLEWGLFFGLLLAEQRRRVEA